MIILEQGTNGKITVHVADERNANRVHDALSSVFRGAEIRTIAGGRTDSIGGCDGWDPADVAEVMAAVLGSPPTVAELRPIDAPAAEPAVTPAAEPAITYADALEFCEAMGAEFQRAIIGAYFEVSQ